MILHLFFKTLNRIKFPLITLWSFEPLLFVFKLTSTLNKHKLKLKNSVCNSILVKVLQFLSANIEVSSKGRQRSRELHCLLLIYNVYYTFYSLWISFLLWKCQYSFSDGPGADPLSTQCLGLLCGLKWWEQMMTVGCITPWDDFGKRMTKSDKATADCNICPPQMLHSLSEAIGSKQVTLFWPVIAAPAVGQALSL